VKEGITPDEALAIAWGHFMRTGSFDNAFLVAYLLRTHANLQKDERLIKNAKDVIHKTAEEMITQSDHNTFAVKDKNPQCSFCDRAEPEVKLGAGHGSFICNICSTKFFRMLNGPN